MIASMSLVSRDTTRPVVYRSWKLTSSFWKWMNSRRRSSSSTFWPTRPDSRRKSTRLTVCTTRAPSISPIVSYSAVAAAARQQRRDAEVDAALDQPRDRQPGRVLDHHDRDQQPDDLQVRPQQVDQQGPAALLQEPAGAVGHLVVVLGGDPAPLLDAAAPALVPVALEGVLGAGCPCDR